MLIFFYTKSRKTFIIMGKNANAMEAIKNETKKMDERSVGNGSGCIGLDGLRCFFGKQQ
jgi:hypothetical protein